MSKTYDRLSIQQVKEKADIRDYIAGCKHKPRQTVTCPFCGQDKFAVEWSAKKKIAHCWACERTLTNAIDALMQIQGMTFVEAIEKAAISSGITIQTEEAIIRDTAKPLQQSKKKPFAIRQLEESGLTPEDIVAKVIDDKGNEAYMVPMRPGSIYPPFSPSESGDDMLIYYYDLEGRQKKYVRRGDHGKAKPYVRVRYQNPELYADETGKAPKYKTPAGAPSQMYIPQVIRAKYQAGTPIDTLFIQEGEKKAEKACKHGILSIAAQGINNFGSAEGGLLQEITDIVRKCSVKNIVLMMDSDWDDLHKNIITGDTITQRPNSFAKAVIKFKQFVGTLHNNRLEADVWWGHVNKNERGDKGIDDLLNGSLKGREGELLEDIDHAMHAHNGKGVWTDIHKISTLSDKRIEDFWLLNDDQAFYDAHKDRLAGVETFKIKNIRYKVENEKLIQFNKYSSDNDIWRIERDDDGNVKKVDINFLETIELLRANGFVRLREPQPDGRSSYDYIRIDEGIIDRTSTVDIRDFVREYMKGACRLDFVKEKFARSIDSWLADKKLESLPAIESNFDRYVPEEQHLYYNNGMVSITSQDISPGRPFGNVWRTRIKPRKFVRKPIVKSIIKVDGKFRLELTTDGEKCEFLQYLGNISNTFYRHDSERELTMDEYSEYALHLINKITSIGYLLCDYKFKSEKKVVVMQDRKISAVGQAGGGSGKSILGEAIGYVTPQVFINGKSDDSEKFFFDQVTRATRNIFIDDVRTNFNFKNLYAMVTGNFVVQKKNTDPLVMEFATSPKILITTNDTINGFEEDATKRRISYMEASQWYNPEHTLIMDFKHLFFDEWDDYQWNLFDNLMAECVMYYLRSMEEEWGKKGEGMIAPPMANIQVRALRQQMSEVFFAWAEDYFDPQEGRMNQMINRKEMFDNCMQFASGTKHDITPIKFRKKLESYCRMKGYDINPGQKNEEGYSYADYKQLFPDKPFLGGRHKSNAIEYITVYSPEFEDKPF